MLNDINEQALKQLEILVPEKWPSDLNIPLIEGERLLVASTLFEIQHFK